MIKSIKPEKMKEFLEDFSNNPMKWYKAQIEEDFEFDEETQLKIIEKNFYVKNEDCAIQYIKNPTKEVCLRVVKQDCSAIQYIEDPTEEVCLEAVKQDYRAFEYIENPTEAVWLEVIKVDCWLIQYIENPTEKVCLEAVKQNCWVIEHIENPTEKVCIEAIKEDANTICCIDKPNQSFDIVKAFFEHYGSSDWEYYKNSYIYLAKKFITKEQGLIMIEDDPENINLLTEKVQKEIFELKPELKRFITTNHEKINVDWFK